MWFCLSACLSTRMYLFTALSEAQTAQCRCLKMPSIRNFQQSPDGVENKCPQILRCTHLQMVMKTNVSRWWWKQMSPDGGDNKCLQMVMKTNVSRWWWKQMSPDGGENKWIRVSGENDIYECQFASLLLCLRGESAITNKCVFPLFWGFFFLLSCFCLHRFGGSFFCFVDVGLTEQWLKWCLSHW